MGSACQSVVLQTLLRSKERSWVHPDCSSLCCPCSGLTTTPGCASRAHGPTLLPVAPTWAWQRELPHSGHGVGSGVHIAGFESCVSRMLALGPHTHHWNPLLRFPHMKNRAVTRASAQSLVPIK